MQRGIKSRITITSERKQRAEMQEMLFVIF